MRYLEIAIPEDNGYLIPIGDIHWGDKSFKNFGRQKLKGYLDWVQERQNAFIFLMGDIYNTSSRNSKTSPFETNNTEYNEAVEFFKPYKDKIIGAIGGNHEERMYDEFGVNPLSFFCQILGIPYCKYSALMRFKVGKRKEKDSDNRYCQNYFVFAHHTNGGGSTIGSKMNRVAKEAEIMEGCDVYLGAHNHQLGVIPQDIFYPSIQGGIRKRRRWFVDCGSFLEWNDSYAEKGMLAPAKLGSPRIRFNGERTKHDVHISL